MIIFSGQYSWLNLERRVLEHEYAQKNNSDKHKRNRPLKSNEANISQIKSTNDAQQTTTSLQCEFRQATRKRSSVNKLKNLKRKQQTSSLIDQEHLGVTGSVGCLHSKPKPPNTNSLSRLDIRSGTKCQGNNAPAMMPPLPPIPVLNKQDDDGDGKQSPPSTIDDPLYDVINENHIERTENFYSELKCTKNQQTECKQIEDIGSVETNSSQRFTSIPGATIDTVESNCDPGNSSASKVDEENENEEVDDIDEDDDDDDCLVLYFLVK